MFKKIISIFILSSLLFACGAPATTDTSKEDKKDPGVKVTKEYKVEVGEDESTEIY